jgi:hypothetical protein
LPDLFSLASRNLAVEWPLLLECCAPRVDTKRIQALTAENPDWRLLLDLADEHGVISQLHTGLISCGAGTVPEEIQKSLQERHRAQLLSTLSFTAELIRVLGVLRTAKVETLVVKGPVLSVRAYGDAGLRQYVDLDLLVRGSDLLSATKAMVGAGYVSDVPWGAIEAGKIPGEYLFTKSGTRLLVELHTERTFRYFPLPMPMEKYFGRGTVVLRRFPRKMNSC